MLLQPKRAVFAAIAMGLVSELLAHGGQYRGPGLAPPPSTGAPTTAPRSSSSTGTSWQLWWEHNKEDLLRPREDVSGPVSGSDEFYLGARRGVVSRASVLPTDADRADRIAKALAEVLVASSDRDLTTASMVGLAKVGFDLPTRRLRDLFAARLAEANQEVRETAALAMGIAGAQDAWPLLASLLAGDAEGRKLAGGKEEVPDRSRTFAAWSLGLLASRTSDVEVKQKTFELLDAQLRDPADRSRDLRVALVHAIGLIDPQAERSSKERLLRYRVVDALWAFYDLDLGKGNQLVQSHAPAAIARTIGRGKDAEHERAKERLVRELTAEGRSNQIRQSAALALGAICMQEEEHAADAACSQALAELWKHGTDQQARYYAIASLGRIGGKANRKRLMLAYAPANRTEEKPWIAIALGLVARDQRLRDGALDPDLGAMLLSDLRSIEVDTARAGIALALGLCAHEPAVPDLRGMLDTKYLHEVQSGYVVVALAMLGDHGAAGDIVALMRTAVRRPFVLQQCAVALGHLGDTETVPALLEMLKSSESTATMAAIAQALGELRDRRSIEPLIAALQDPDRSALARAFVAAALGGVGDKDVVRWNAAIARDVNYSALVDTLSNGNTGVLDIL